MGNMNNINISGDLTIRVNTEMNDTPDYDAFVTVTCDELPNVLVTATNLEEALSGLIETLGQDMLDHALKAITSYLESENQKDA